MELRDRLVKFATDVVVGKWYSKDLKENVFFVRLNTKDGTTFGKSIQKDEDIVAKIILKSVCDEEGKLLFKAADLATINDLPISFTSGLFEEILRFNKMIPEGKGSSPEEESAKN